MDCKVCQELHKRELDGFDIKEGDLKGTALEYEQLMKNPAWKDIEDMLYSHIINMRDELEIMGKGADPEDRAYTQGQLFQSKFFLNLPLALKEKKEEALHEHREPEPEQE